MPELQKTIEKEVSLRGVGVHTGLSSRVDLKPAPCDHGVIFVRSDCPDQPPIPAFINSVTDTGQSGQKVFHGPDPPFCRAQGGSPAGVGQTA